MLPYTSPRQLWLNKASRFTGTIPAGELPITPRITPGWSVSGVILIISGLAYTLVGIKSKGLHAFVSAAALGALGTAVLIIYVMPVPVRDSIQGAYVVAAICTGAVLGGASVVFKETTECLSCLLGGFCFSMWILALHDGGLLTEQGPKAALIVSFTVAGFALYFSRWTRPPAMIGCISIAGATLVVLGIDCFSRAGLKEFWAYIWALNPNLFPLSADSYPITRGMRVELAATVLIAILGIVSQVKLWRIIKDRRTKRASMQAESDLALQDEEQTAGRRIEEENSRERKEWERVYGNGASFGGSADSGVGDMDGEKNGDVSHSSTEGSRTPGGGTQHRVSMPEAPGTAISQSAKDGVITVRVARDDVPTGAPGEEGEGGSPRSSAAVVPFGVVAPDDDEEERSSVATFADEEGGEVQGSRRQSMVNRLSATSSRLLRRLSQRSKGNDLELGEYHGESREELVESRQSRNDDNDSLAANLDDMSVDDSDANTVRDGGVEDDADGDAENPDRPATANEESVSQNPELAATETAAGEVSGDGTEDPSSGSSATSGQLAKTDASASPTGTQETTPREGGSLKGSDERSPKAKSVASVNSLPANVTRTNLPRALSRVAMSYRTNEWAKHLAAAETPEPENLVVDEPAAETSESSSNGDDEKPAPLNIEELQQTAETATQPPALVRSVSVMSSNSQGQALPQNNSRSSLNIPTANLEAYRALSGNSKSHASLIYAQPIAEEVVPSGFMSTPNLEAPGAAFDPSATSTSLASRAPTGVSYSSPQTLLGMRESFLRNKSQASFYMAGALGPEATSRRSSEAGSMYNYPMYPSAAAVAATSGVSLDDLDADDLPLSQRREIMRRASAVSWQRNSSAAMLAGGAIAPVDTPTAEAIPFNSHQPQRAAIDNAAMSDAARRARMASFRNSVAADLRAGSAIVTNGGNGPYVNGNSTLNVSGINIYERDNEVRRTVDAQRGHLLGLREAEAQRKEAQRKEKERTDREFEERMRRGDLMHAHRAAMRRMQSGVKG